MKKVDLKAKYDLAIETLENIADPIEYLRKEALKDGCELNGWAATQFANNGVALSRMADKCLEEIKNMSKEKDEEKETN